MCVLGLIIKGIGLGNIEEKTSYGLGPAIGVLMVLASAWGQWVVREVKNGSKGDGGSQ